MTPQQEWSRLRDELVSAVVHLGFPQELGFEIAKNLGSPKAMSRMVSYLQEVKPKSVELVVDEMLMLIQRSKTRGRLRFFGGRS